MAEALTKLAVNGGSGRGGMSDWLAQIPQVGPAAQKVLAPYLDKISALLARKDRTIAATTQALEQTQAQQEAALRYAQNAQEAARRASREAWMGAAIHVGTMGAGLATFAGFYWMERRFEWMRVPVLGVRPSGPLALALIGGMIITYAARRPDAAGRENPNYERAIDLFAHMAQGSAAAFLSPHLDPTSAKPAKTEPSTPSPGPVVAGGTIFNR